MEEQLATSIERGDLVPARNVIDPTRALASLSAPDPRIVWAAERTALAWIRTGVALIAFGFVLARAPVLFEGLRLDTTAIAVLAFAGVSMMVAGVVASVASALRFRRTLERLLRGDVLMHSSTGPLLAAVAIGAAGVALAVWAVLALA